MDKINGKSMGSHRAAWIRLYGEIPAGLVVCHKCDNGLCINTDHLFLGTYTDNMRDCIEKGRFRPSVSNQKGSKNGNARPDYDFIKQDVKRRRLSGETYKQIRNALNIKSNGHLRNLILS
jgi:hypothetical protein